jgi:hypothetical protein
MDSSVLSIIFIIYYLQDRIEKIARDVFYDMLAQVPLLILF